MWMLVVCQPFSSVRKLVDQYYLFGCLPLLKPLSMIPFAPRKFFSGPHYQTFVLILNRASHMVHGAPFRYPYPSSCQWQSCHSSPPAAADHHISQDIKSSVLIAHAGNANIPFQKPNHSKLPSLYLPDNDKDIPVSHASMLFDAFLEPYLPAYPSLPENPLSRSEWDNYTNQDTLRTSRRKEVVTTTRIEGYGVLEEIQPSVAALEGRQVALLMTERGGHDIGRVEGVQDAIGRMFGFYWGLLRSIGGLSVCIQKCEDNLTDRELFFF